MKAENYRDDVKNNCDLCWDATQDRINELEEEIIKLKDELTALENQRNEIGLA